MAIVDIAVPCYRYGHFLETCVQSVLTQSIADVRILIIDDASPDGSAEVARKLAASDSRISLSLHSKNQGHIASFNEGIAWASSPFFMTLSADDYLAPGALERAVTVMTDNPAVVLTYGAAVQRFADDDAISLDDEPSSDSDWRVKPGRALIEDHCRQARNLIASPTVIVRTETQKRIGGYLEALPHSNDLEMWLRFAANGQIAETQRAQAVYRVHGANMSIGYLRAVLDDYTQRADAFEAFFEADGRLVEDWERLHALARRRLAASAFWTGVAQWSRGNRDIGAEVVRFAFGLEPRMRFAPPLSHLLRPVQLNRALHSALPRPARGKSARSLSVSV